VRFRVCTKDMDDVESPTGPGIYVESDRWWDARAVGIVHFGCGPDELRFHKTSEDADIETRWVGTDNGGALGRRMQFRKRNGSKVGRWRGIEEYEA